MTSFQGSTNFKKFEKTYLRKREEGRKEGRQGGRERGREGGRRWALTVGLLHTSRKVYRPPSHTGPAKSQAKPSQNQTKPNQAGLLLVLLLLLLMIFNQQTKSSLLTYLLFRSNKQTNQPKTIQPTNQPTPLPPPHPKQTKQNKRVCSRFQTTKTKYSPLPPSLPPSPVTNP